MALASAAAIVTATAFGGGIAHAGLAPAGEIPITYWCGPPRSALGDAAAARARVAQIKAAGFNVVMFPCNDGTWDVATTRLVLDAAAEQGLKVVISDSRVHAAVASETTAGLDDVIADYASHPGLGGYFVADEPLSGAAGSVGAVIRYLRAHDPDHPAFANLLPIWADAVRSSYPSYLDSHLRAGTPELFSFDNYRLDANTANLAAARAASLAHATPFWQFVLSTAHPGYAQPTAAQKLYEGMQTLAYGGAGIGYFTYWTVTNPGFGEAMIRLDGTTTSQYAEMPAINARLQTIGRELRTATSRYTFQNGTPESGARRRPAGAPVRIASAAPVTVGVFDKPGYVYTLVTNRNYSSSAVVTAQLSYNGSLPERLSASGSWATATPDSTGGGSLATYTTTLAAGDAALYRVRTPLVANDEVVVGRVRDNGPGELFAVDSYGVTQPEGIGSWGQCPSDYTYIGQNQWVNGFWLCLRDDLSSRGVYAGNVVSNYGMYFRAQGGAMTQLGTAGWNQCPSTARLVGRLEEPNGFWVCLDAAGRLGPEAVVGRVRNNVGEWDVVDSQNGNVNAGGASWGQCPEGYGYVGKNEWANGFWLCARRDLVPRLFYVGNVVNNAGSYFSVQWGTVSLLGPAGWNRCDGTSRLIGRWETSDGFWLCLQ